MKWAENLHGTIAYDLVDREAQRLVQSRANERVR